MSEVSARDAADGEHRAILAALTAGDADRAAALLRAHWASGMDLICAWIEARETG
ncbi:MAG: FCD domain-containing protein [Streptosporangiales bacterium]|nr:FCD domain-containing protein [Streptosporangiales bacterium]